MLTNDKMKKIYNLIKEKDNFKYSFDDFTKACRNVSDDELNKVVGGKILNRKRLSLALTAMLTPSMVGISPTSAFTKADLTSKAKEVGKKVVDFAKDKPYIVAPAAILSAGAAVIGSFGIGFTIYSIVDHIRNSKNTSVTDDSLKNVTDHFNSIAEADREQAFESTVKNLDELLSKNDATEFVKTLDEKLKSDANLKTIVDNVEKASKEQDSNKKGFLEKN